LPRLTKSHTRAAAIFIDELDAGGFQSLPNDFKCRAARLAASLFELMDSHDTDPRPIGQHLLTPAK
jgi:hypothetical protein